MKPYGTRAMLTFLFSVRSLLLRFPFFTIQTLAATAPTMTSRRMTANYICGGCSGALTRPSCVRTLSLTRGSSGARGPGRSPSQTSWRMPCAGVVAWCEVDVAATVVGLKG